MNILIILVFGLFWSCHAYHHTDGINIVDLNSITLCATLNNVNRTFSNIWEIYSEFKATGQLWIPVAIDACPMTFGDCTTFVPICAVSGDNFYKTFHNKCVLEAEQKSTGTVWNVVFNGVCSANSDGNSQTALYLENSQNGESLSLTEANIQSPNSDKSHQIPVQAVNDRPSLDPYTENCPSCLPVAKEAQAVKQLVPESSFIYDRFTSSHSAGQHNSVQQSNVQPNYAEQNSVQISHSSLNSPNLIRSNQLNARPQGEKISSLTVAGNYNFIQQPQALINYPEPIQTFGNEQENKNSGQSSCEGSSLSGAEQYNLKQQSQPEPNHADPIQSFGNKHSHNSNPTALHSQTKEASSSDSTGNNILIQRSQPLPDYPRELQPFSYEKTNQNSAKVLASSNQVTNHLHKASYEGSSLSEAEQYNSNQQPQPKPNYAEPLQALENSHSQNSNPAVLHSQEAQDSFSPAPGNYKLMEQQQPLSNYRELIHTFSNEQNPRKLSASSAYQLPSRSSIQEAVQSNMDQAFFYEGSSPSATGKYNSIRKQQPGSNYPEPVKTFEDEHSHNSNRNADHSSSNSAGIYNPIQQPQTSLNHPEPIQPLGSEHVRVNQNSVGNLPLSVNPNPIPTNSQADQAGNYQSKPYHPEPIQPFEGRYSHNTNLSPVLAYSHAAQDSSSALQRNCESSQPSQPKQPCSTGQPTENSPQSPIMSNLAISNNLQQNALPSQDEHSSSLTAAEDYNFIQQPQVVPTYSEPIQPFENKQINQNSELAAASTNSPLFSDSNQISLPTPAKQSPLIPLAGTYNSIQLQPQQIQFFDSGDFSQKLADGSNQVGVLLQAVEIASVEATENHNLNNQHQIIASSNEPIQPFTEGKRCHSSAQLAGGYSNQIIAQPQAEQSSSSSLALAAQCSSDQQPQQQTVQNYPGEFSHNSARLTDHSAYPPFDRVPPSGNSNQIAAQAQSERGSFSTAKEDYKSIQWPQFRPHTLEAVQPFVNGQFSVNSGNLEHSGNSNLLATEPQVEPSSSAPYSAHSLGSSLLSSQINSENQVQPQPLPNYLESSHEQLSENSVPSTANLLNIQFSVNSNQAEQGSSLNTAGQQPQNVPSYTESIKTLDSGNINKNPELSSLPCSNDGSLSPAKGEYNPVQQSQNQPSYPETILQYIKIPINQNSPQILEATPTSKNSDNTVILPVAILTPVANNEDTLHSCEQTSGQAEDSYSSPSDACSSDTEFYGNAQSFSNSASNSPSKSVISADYSNNFKNQQHSSDAQSKTESTTYSNDNGNSNHSAQAPTVYNGVVYQGPYYYEPEYKHINYGHVNFLPAPESIAVALTNLQSAITRVNGDPASYGPEYHQNPFEHFLKQLKYAAGKKEKFAC